MSHRAVVAIQNGPETFNLYYSHNGAHELQLRDQLAENARELCQTGGRSLPQSVSTASVPQVEKWQQGIQQNQNIKSKFGDGIDESPTATDVPLDYVGAPIDYANIEAFYLVRNGTVTTFVPVWLWPNVVRPIRQHLELEVHRGGRWDDDPEQMMDRLDNADPLRVIDQESLTGNYLGDTVVTDIVRDHHAAIYALWDQMDDKGVPENVWNGPDEKPDPCGVLHLDNYIILLRVLDLDATPPPSGGLGMLVELSDRATEADRERVWQTGSSARFNIGAGLNAISSDPDREDIASSITDVLLELYDEFGDRISRYSPPPTGVIIRLLHESGYGEDYPVPDDLDEADELAVSGDALHNLLADTDTSSDDQPDSLSLPGN